MMRILVATASLAFVVIVTPVWTARWVEDRRMRELQLASQSTKAVSVCPVDDSFYAYLDRHSSSASRSLWKPVCQKADAPAGVVAVIVTGPESFRQCRENLRFNRTSIAQCWLDPIVNFLPRPETRTFARIMVPDHEGNEIFWTTSVPLAWRERLESEHRRWILIALAMTGTLLWFSRSRWLEAAAIQRNLDVSGVRPPARMERLLLCILPPFNVPQEIDDLRETYAELVVETGRRHANSWYLSHARRSFVYYARQWCREIWRRVSAHSNAGRRP